MPTNDQISDALELEAHISGKCHFEGRVYLFECYACWEEWVIRHEHDGDIEAFDLEQAAYLKWALSSQ